ncbi:MAG: anion permease, partial [Firmicutes bacterium]|nr:anion permease [Bacillota bacterium]
MKPSASYINYIDFKTLVLLFSLMAVVAGFGDIGVFQKLSSFFIKKAGSVRKMCLVLVLLSFFLSMLVTNDVALITLVPLTIIIMHSASVKHMEYTVILQTVAANLGSMMTPFGNPQNLYLYSFYEMQIWDFLKIVAAPGILGLVAVVVLSFRVPAEPVAAGAELKSGNDEITDSKQFVIYCVLFIICILTVLRVVPYQVSGAVVLAVMLVIDRRILLRVDYGLLVTFVFFFIFVGNMGEIPAVSQFLTSVIEGREVLV